MQCISISWLGQLIWDKPQLMTANCIYIQKERKFYVLLHFDQFELT